MDRLLKPQQHALVDHYSTIASKCDIPLIAYNVPSRTGCDIATCGMIIKNEEDKTNPAVVKIVMGLKPGEEEARCLYFTRATAPFTRNPEKCPNQDLYHHIGIYVFKAESLKKMVSLETGVLEPLEIPVKPGRNLPIIIETAAMNERLKSMGYYSAKEFNQNILKWIETGAAQAAYYGSDDSY